MSAFVVSEDTILTLAIFAAGADRFMDTIRPDGIDLNVALRYARQLHAENVASVEHRYRLSDPALAGVGRYPPPAVVTPRDLHRLQRWLRNPVAILKLAQCYDYQACEHPGWLESAAHRLIKSIIADAIRRLPGYEGEPWGLS